MGLRELRLEKELSQNELSKLSGVSARMIQYYEQGVKDINKAQAQSIYQLSQALNCRMEDLIMKNVINMNGTEIDFEQSIELMDDEIREDLHNKLAPCSDQVFFTEYEKAHQERFGEEWELSKANPTW